MPRASHSPWPEGPASSWCCCYDFRNDVQAYFATRHGRSRCGRYAGRRYRLQQCPCRRRDAVLQPGHLGVVRIAGAGTGRSAARIRRHDLQPGAGDRSRLPASMASTPRSAMFISTRWSRRPTTRHGQPTLIFGDHFIFGTSGIARPRRYPIVQVPAGDGVRGPLGISFFGTAFSEPTLIKLASGYEAFTQTRAHNLPTFNRTVPFDHIQGTTLHPSKNLTVPPPSAKPAAPSNNAPKTPAKEQKVLHHL